jgi:hypothetical protein
LAEGGLQCLRDELVRRDYAASTTRKLTQIVEAFRRHTGARLDRSTPQPEGSNRPDRQFSCARAPLSTPRSP